MADKKKHLSHVKSKVLEEKLPQYVDEAGNGSLRVNVPKLPTKDDLVEGEIAINYAQDNETISLKNENEEIVTFSSDKEIVANEEVVAQALNQLNERLTPVESNSDQMDEVAAAAFNELNGVAQDYNVSNEVSAAAFNQLKEMYAKLEKRVAALESE